MKRIENLQALTRRSATRALGLADRDFKPTATIECRSAADAKALRSQAGKSHTYMVPVEERARLRQLTEEYRRYQRCRAVLIKRHLKLLEWVDQMAEKRLINWPEKKLNSLE